MRASAPIFPLLIVDDDPLVCELLTQLLRKDGFIVDAVTSGEAALGALQHQVYSAVLTDLQMPGTDGLELARRIRTLPEPPILLGMSARPLGPHEQHTLDEFLQKPFAPDDVRAALARAVSARRAFSPEDTSPLQLFPSEADNIPESGEVSTAILDSLVKAPSGVSDANLEGVLDLQIFSRLRSTIGFPQLAQLYEMTADDVEARLLRMHACLQSEDLLTLQGEAHAIKGGCAMVGAVELSQLASLAEARSETDTAHLKEMAKACVRLRQVVTIVSP